MNSNQQFRTIPAPPGSVTASAIITRMVDGLGFRYFWATEGLRKNDYKLQPQADMMSLGQLITHIWHLIDWVHTSIISIKKNKPQGSPDILREETLQTLWELHCIFSQLENEELQNLTIADLSVWHFINGPLSDALTHVGQINSYRRMAGNPVSSVNVFTGNPEPLKRK